MRSLAQRFFLFLCSMFFVFFLSGCGNNTGVSKTKKLPKYHASITYTKYGVPHITASSFKNLGFGIGFAQSKENLCTLADQILKIKSERSKYFGAGEKQSNLISDASYKALNYIDDASDLFPTLSQKSQDVLIGYVAGFNKVLSSFSSPNDYPSSCKGAEWVTKITPQELLAYHIDIASFASSRQFHAAMAMAQPPQQQSTKVSIKSFSPLVAPVLKNISSGLGSNGWALGRDKVDGASAELLANPHFPWGGELRFFQQQLTIPGKMNVMGVTFVGFPAVLIGFNDDIAWTHTVSESKRFTLYQLHLDPNNPLKYQYDGKLKDITSSTVNIEVKQPDGSLKMVPWTFYQSHFGPLVNLGQMSPALAWTSKSAIALKDANKDNVRMLDQWLDMDEAHNQSEFFSAFAKHQADPWVNTLLVTKDGEASYIDGAQVPQLSPGTELYWRVASQSPQLKPLWNGGKGAVLLPGNSSDFEWINTGDAGAPGLIPFRLAPKQTRSDYEFNSNDSYWLSNLSEPLERYSTMYGPTRTIRSPRARYNGLMLTQPNNYGLNTNDGRFSFSALKHAFDNNGSLFSNTFKSQLVDRCSQADTVTIDGTTVELSSACEALKHWDGLYQLNSTGAQVMREFLSQYRVSSAQALSNDLFDKPFDPNEPMTTPSGLATYSGSNTNDDPVLIALAKAVMRLNKAGIVLNAPLSSIQYVLKQNMQPIPVSGGAGFEGVFNVAVGGTARFNSTLIDHIPVGTQEGNSTLSSLTENGKPLTRYRINYGSSFVMALMFKDGKPQADMFLSSSQSQDPKSKHFTDQTKLYSHLNWRHINFTPSDIKANTVSKVEISGD